jgi:hypothetical protein
MRLLTDDAGIRKIGSGTSTKERKQRLDKDFDTVMAGVQERRKEKSMQTKNRMTSDRKSLP